MKFFRLSKGCILRLLTARSTFGAVVVAILAFVRQLPVSVLVRGFASERYLWFRSWRYLVVSSELGVYLLVFLMGSALCRWWKPPSGGEPKKGNAPKASLLLLRVPLCLVFLYVGISLVPATTPQIIADALNSHDKKKQFQESLIHLEFRADPASIFPLAESVPRFKCSAQKTKVISVIYSIAGNLALAASVNNDKEAIVEFDEWWKQHKEYYQNIYQKRIGINFRPTIKGSDIN